jgi:integrase
MRRESLRTRRRHANNTQRCYASHLRAFVAWCQQTGKSSLPATAETLALYVTWMLTEQKYKISTAKAHINSVADSHRRAGIMAPEMADAYEVINAIRRQRREFPLGKTALSVQHLRKACDGALRGPDTNRTRRDLAIVVFGFATGLRRSEIAALDLADIKFRGPGLSVRVRFAKNDQDGEGRTLGVWAGERASTDPVRTLKRWLEVRGDWEGPLFSLITRRDVILRQKMGDDRIADAVKRAVARAGLDPTGYGGHSLRSGAVTAAADRGMSDRELMRLSGHKSSNSVQSYIRESEVFSGRNPLPGVL